MKKERFALPLFKKGSTVTVKATNEQGVVVRVTKEGSEYYYQIGNEYYIEGELK